MADEDPKTPVKGPDFNKLMETIFGGAKTDPSGEKAASGENSLFEKTMQEAVPGIKKFFSSQQFQSLFSKKQPMFSTGLDIGTSAVKSACFQCESDSKRLVSLDIEEIAHSDFESASRPELIAEKIRKMQARHSIRGNIYVSVGLPNLLVEFMYLPVMPQDELDKAVRWEAKERLLVDEETYVIDYMTLGEVNVAQQAQKEILFFSVPKKDILDNYKILSGLGLRPQAIRPNFLASFKAFQNKSVWRNDEIVGLLDMGAGSSSFSVISKGDIHFSRRISISGDSITRSIADYCQISYEEAERTKRDAGMSRMALEEDRKVDTVADHPRVRISHAIGLHLDQLITEIQHTFNYFSLEVSEVPVEKMNRLIITGGGASVKGIIDFLKSRLDAPVEIANPFNYVQSKLEISDLTQLSDKGLRFAAAVGLAQGD